MFEHYYGIQHEEKFEALFGGYYTGQPGKATPQKNRHYILHFDFSGIDTQQPARMQNSFNVRINKGLKKFHDSYQGFDRNFLSEADLERNPADYLSSFSPISDQIYPKVKYSSS